MEVAFAVRNYIRNSVKPGNMFTTRELLGLGNRNTIDQVIYRLIKEGTVIRLAWGVFVRKDDFQGSGDILPSATAVANVKAQAFGRSTFIHGAELEEVLNLIEEANRKSLELKTKKVLTKVSVSEDEFSKFSKRSSAKPGNRACQQHANWLS
jgi:hypothetical protein